MDVYEVVGVDGRILVGPLIDLFRLIGVPVNDSRRAGDYFVAVERRQHVEKLLGVLRASLLTRLRLHILTCEIVHIDLIPVASHLMSILRIEANLLDGTSCQVVIRSYVGVGRTNVVLNTDCCYYSCLVANESGKVLGVEIRKESKHLIIRHCTLIGASHLGRPVSQLKVVGEVAHESNTRGDSLELASAKCGSGVGEGATLTLSLSIEVRHVAGRTCSHEVNGTYHIHIGTTIIILVLIAKVIGEPVTILIGEVAVDTVGAVAGRTIVDTLTTGREDKLCIVAAEFVAAAVKTPRCSILTFGAIARVIALIVHDDRMFLAVVRLCIVATNSNRLTVAVAHRLELN